MKTEAVFTLAEAKQAQAGKGKPTSPSIRNLAAHVVSAHEDVNRAQERLKVAERALAAELKKVKEAK